MVLPPNTRILGILNLTRDSFSDGGRYLEPKLALAHAKAMMQAGADGIDVGAESTHPDSEDVDAAEELRRLVPVLRSLKEWGIPVSVDTWKAPVMEAVLPLGVTWINDVHGFRDPRSLDAVRNHPVHLIVMHNRSLGYRATRDGHATELSALESVEHFFSHRPLELAQGGIEPGRIILDPGMGFFLGPDPESSFQVLRALPSLRKSGLPILLSVSRKSFICKTLGKQPETSAAGTLAAELYGALAGADFIRTHEPGPLRDGLRILGRL
jgi:dihydropteroate synthase type 2